MKFISLFMMVLLNSCSASLSGAIFNFGPSPTPSNSSSSYQFPTIPSPTPGPNGIIAVRASPHGAVLQTGGSQAFAAVCFYVDGTNDNCAKVGGAVWSSSRTTALTVNASGVATWNSDPGTGSVDNGFAVVKAGGMADEAGVFGQHVGDTWYQYITPAITQYANSVAKVVVGSTVTVGSGLVIDNNGGYTTGTPLQGSCSWTSSNNSIATVNTYGLVTAISPGSVNITCGRSGNGVFGSSSLSGWIAPGNVITLTVVAGGSGTTTWYVRSNGGTPYVSSSATPNGQCDGKHDADYPGTGVNQPCAMSSLRDLWVDRATYGQLKWMINGGDTVIVRQNPNGYVIGADSTPVTNCSAGGCEMPTVPSGSAQKRTQILGENYQNCHSDSSKTVLYQTNYKAFDTTDSQFVDIQCFEVTDKGACTNDGNFTNVCSGSTQYGNNGIIQSAMTGSVNYTDLFIHGLAGTGILGATGGGVVGNYVHIRGLPLAGISMDDGPWLTGNISVAGGLTLANSITEFTGCVEEYPVVHNYPYLECRDQNTGGYGDGFGTASATGDWIFDHDTWRYNYQDGLDLLHSGMQHLIVTNSSSYGNDGQQYKIGSGESVVFQNNLVLHNCMRIGQVIGDEPSSAILPGVSYCRAAGDGIPIAFSGIGKDVFQNNTFVGYGATPYDIECEGGWEGCPSALSIYQNNIFLGISNPAYQGGQLPGLFYDAATLPAHEGWSTRDHNLFYNVRYGSSVATEPGEVYADPHFIGEPPLTISSESQLDNFNFILSNSSPAFGAGVTIPGLPNNIVGAPFANPPNLGAY